jgi:hypothetical protein
MSYKEGLANMAFLVHSALAKTNNTSCPLRVVLVNYVLSEATEAIEQDNVIQLAAY